MLAGVKQERRKLKYASGQLKNDKDLVLTAVQQKGGLQYASSQLKNDKDIVQAAVRQDRGVLSFASKQLQQALSKK